uniref:Uncharacterized protein n=1 Tax=Romanomermis culicivorax TaxID=13658 RepID=A0A915JL33_ROMCU
MMFHPLVIFCLQLRKLGSSNVWLSSSICYSIKGLEVAGSVL